MATSSDNTITISAKECLQKACDIYNSAQGQGLKVPRHISKKFNYDLRTKYVDVFRTDVPNCSNQIGFLIGNKTRLDKDFKRYFVLSFLRFIIRKTTNQLQSKGSPLKLGPLNLLVNFVDPNTEYVTLTRYKPTPLVGSKNSGAYVLNVGGPKVLSFRVKTDYPNITQANDPRVPYSEIPWRTLSKWLTLKYTDDLSKNKVKITPMPKFEAKKNSATNKYEVVPRIKDVPGELAKWTYTQLYAELKQFLDKCLRFVNGARSIADFQIARSNFNIVNLILNKNFVFEIVKDRKALPLFTTISADTSTQKSYRINPSQDIVYLLVATKDDIDSFLEDDTSFEVSAYPLLDESIPYINVYGDVEDGDEEEGVVGLLFTTKTKPSVEDFKIHTWDKGLELDHIHVLDEPVEEFMSCLIVDRSS